MDAVHSVMCSEEEEKNEEDKYEQDKEDAASEEGTGGKNERGRLVEIPVFA